jgi:tRNA pseudouridine38-40 synthase
VLGACEAAPGFDARRSACGKRYAYVIDRGVPADPFGRRYAWHLAQALDEQAMAEGLRRVRGRHDFSAFCAAAGRGRTPLCTVRATRVVRRKRWLVIAISADSFLHHMVRNVVGSLVEVGRGAAPPAWMSELITSRDRTRAGPTAPAQGLALVRVLYGTGLSSGGPCVREEGWAG